MIYNSLFIQNIILPLAFITDFIFKEPPNIFHPVTLLGKYIAWWSNIKVLHNNTRQQKIFSFLYGTIMIILGISFCVAVLIMIFKTTEPFPLLHFLLNIFLLKTSFSAQRLYNIVLEIYKALFSGDIIKARQLTSFHLVSRDTTDLDESLIASAVIESLAENIVDSIISPLAYYLVGGLPFAWAYRFVNTADAMIGYHTEKFEYLGKFTARLDDILNFIPARIGGIIVIFAAFLCRQNTFNAWQTMLSQSKNTESPNAGLPMAAAAGALEVKLEKVNHYQLNGGKSLPHTSDLLKAVHLFQVAVGIWYVFCIMISTLIHWRILY